MPNMFGGGPLKKTMKLLANEVWEEHCMLPACYGGRAERGWRRSCRVVNGHCVSQVSVHSHLFPASRLVKKGLVV
jgi:hypothetical protein